MGKARRADLPHLSGPPAPSPPPPPHCCRECMAWDAPPPPRVRWSLRGGWNLGRLLLADARQEVDLVVLHLPQVQVAALKQLAAGEAQRCFAGPTWHLQALLSPKQRTPTTPPH